MEELGAGGTVGVAWEVADGGGVGTDCVDGHKVTAAKSLPPIRGSVEPTGKWVDMNEEEEKGGGTWPREGRTRRRMKRRTRE